MSEQTPRSVWLLLASLYSTQYLGLGFLLTGLIAIIRDAGASLETLGVVYLIALAWPLKMLWAPLIDRVGFGKLGHYRGWLIITQGGLVMALLGLSLLHPLQDLGKVLCMAALVSFLSASQDTAVNGLVCLILSPRERGPAKSLCNAGHLIGILFGGGLLLMGYELWGWTTSLLILAAGSAVSLVQVLIYQEPAAIAATSRSAPLSTALAPLRGAGGTMWLLLLLTFPINVSMGYGLMTPLLVDAGWSLRSTGFLVNVLGPVAGIIAALVTGRLLQLYTRRSMLIATALLQAPCALGLLLPALQIGGAVGTAVGVSLSYLLYQPASTAILTAMMDRSGVEQPAAAFTMQSSLHMLSGMVAMSASAPLAAAIGYAGALTTAAGLGLVAVVVALLFRMPEPAAAPPRPLPA